MQEEKTYRRTLEETEETVGHTEVRIEFFANIKEYLLIMNIRCNEGIPDESAWHPTPSPHYGKKFTAPTCHRRTLSISAAPVHAQVKH